jgi:glutamine amidotransferase
VIAVLDYGIGNLRSAEKALQKVGADARLVTDAAEASTAVGVVLPGVGNFGRCMEALRDTGLDRAAVGAIDAGKPFLGICVGMQMLYDASDEAPGVDGLGVLRGKNKLLPESVKRPQMQWNVLERRRQSDGLLAGLPEPTWMYFVHSYAPELTDDAVATCDYGGPVTAAVERDNVWATQFHPEKSSDAGMQVLRNFVDRCSQRR